MIDRGSRSIFHLGEEEMESSSVSTDPSDVDPVGLRILIHNPIGVYDQDVRKKVVTKSSSLIRSCGSTTSLPRDISEVADDQMFGFLKTCYSCKKDLNPHKDVYMYRGNQGFCSAECRLRQIMIDESREFQASRSVDHHHSSTAKVGELEKIRKTSSLVA